MPLLGIALLPFKNRFRTAYFSVVCLIALINAFLTINAPIGSFFNYGLIGFVTDKYTWIFILSINVSWAFVLGYAFSFEQYKFRQHENKYLLFLHLSLLAVMANALAENIQTLLIFYLLAIPISYPLLTIRDDERCKEAAKGYMIQTLLPPVLMAIPAFIIIHLFTHSYSFYTGKTFVDLGVDEEAGIALLVLLIFGLSKNSIFPFHTWLPKLRRVPAPVASLAHSVTTVNMGAIALIKIVTSVFGLEFIQHVTANFATGGFIIHIAGFTAVYTAYLAWKSKDLKERLSYSTVGQLMYIIVGILLGTPLTIMASCLHILTHSLAKTGLFFVAGYFDSFFHTTKTKEVAELAPKNIFLVIVVAVCGLSITGIPFLAGSYSKDILLIEAFKGERYMSMLYLVVGSFINFLYIYPIMKAAFRKGVKREMGFAEIPFSMKVVFILIPVLIIAFSFVVGTISDLMSQNIRVAH